MEPSSGQGYNGGQTGGTQYSGSALANAKISTRPLDTDTLGAVVTMTRELVLQAHQLVSALEDRLASVLDTNDPRPSSPPGPGRPPSTPNAVNLRAIGKDTNDVLQELCQRLERLRERVQV